MHLYTPRFLAASFTTAKTGKRRKRHLLTGGPIKRRRPLCTHTPANSRRPEEEAILPFGTARLKLEGIAV